MSKLNILNMFQYPDKILWSINLDNKLSADDVISSSSLKKDAKKILYSLAENNYILDVENVNEKLLNEFMPIYTQLLSTKENAMVHDLYKTLLGKNGEKKAFAITLRKYGDLKGAMMFRKYKKSLSIHYKVFPNNLDFKTRNAITSAIDYYGINYAIKHNLNEYILGRDRNIYGKNANIGLAKYKISIGAIPTLSKVSAMLDFDKNIATDRDLLIFYSKSNDYILDQAILYSKLSDKEIKNLYGAFYKSDKVKLEVVKY